MWPCDKKLKAHLSLNCSYVPSDGDINKWMKKGYYLGVTG
jgi:hypothetical protein